MIPICLKPDASVSKALRLTTRCAGLCLLALPSTGKPQSSSSVLSSSIPGSSTLNQQNSGSNAQTGGSPTPSKPSTTPTGSKDGGLIGDIVDAVTGNTGGDKQVRCCDPCCCDVTSACRHGRQHML